MRIFGEYYVKITVPIRPNITGSPKHIQPLHYSITNVCYVPV